MPDENVIEKLCEERRGNLSRDIQRLEIKTDKVSNQLNRFLLLTISTLIAVILNFVTTLIK